MRVYVFAGWSDGSTTYAAAATYPSSGTVASNVTLTAQWTANTLTVTYNSQIGSSITAGSTSTGGSIDVSPGTPTRTGYTFAGWFVATSGGLAITFPYAHGQTANFTLYAQWTAATCANGGVCALGDIGPGGGKVFYVHVSGNFTSTGSDCGTACKYLEAAPSDHSSQVAWCSNITSSLGVTATGIGSGMSNTNTADSFCTSGAIQVAADYTNNSKTDWHLPSKDELAQLYIQRTTVGGFTAGYYLSSSENPYPYQYVWVQHFSDGYQTFSSKDFPYFYVRPVRAFG